MAESSETSSKSSSLVSFTSSSNSKRFKYNLLEKNTDLNEQPEWNNSFAILLSYLLQQSAHHDDILGSFRSANAHIDNLADVDLISDAENIKKLLKMPFNKHSQISMMVHRLGRTVLLDEFDIHSHILRLEKTDWNWFREFFVETVLRNISVKHIQKKNKTRNELIRKDRLVNFLYQSLDLPDLIDILKENQNQVNATTSKPSPFQRSVNWTFENIKMLIGSDLPIFGDEKHPAVSLRLRDMNKPINVLTGIDYWLDNLMCNVPELAMCYHVDGIVQSYEVVKTEDIPYREGCHFSPMVIRDLATNLLSFLKANATKEGHTYWLFKSPDDDIVKLYDLSSLCETRGDENPYTLPVASLLYKMAQNIVSKSDHETRSKESGTIRTLLKHCLDMLNPEKFPEYHCAAAYMMSDLYIDDNVSEQSWTSDGSDVDDRDSLTENDFDEEQPSISIETLTKPMGIGGESKSNVERLKPIHGNLERRATEALKYLVEALKSNSIHRRMQQVQEDSQSDETSRTIVPLPFHATRHSSKILIDQKNHLTNDRRLKAIVLHKASAAYFCLVDRHEKEKNYGSCLRYLRMALNCYSAEMKFQSIDSTGTSSSESKKLLSYIMSIAGDCRLMMAHVTSTDEIDKFREQYQMVDQVDREIQRVIDEVLSDEATSEFSWVSEFTAIIDRNLFASVHAYEYAINLVKNFGEQEKKRLHLLTKRFGNVRSEMAVFWMNRCAQAVKSLTAESAKEVKDLFRKSFESFDAALQAFESINDTSNMALIFSNLGRLMRHYAQFYAPVVNGVRQEFSSQERQTFQKAFDYYLRGLKLVEHRQEFTDVFRNLSWDLSNTYFTMATTLQDFAPLSSMSQDEIEKEIQDLMLKALKHLEFELNNPSCDRFQTGKFRAATIHHRLGSLLHNAFRTESNQTRRKHLRALATSHYQKALKLFSIKENPLEYLRLLIEEVAMIDFELQNAAESNHRLKHAQHGLQSALQCHSCVSIIDQRQKSIDADDFSEQFAQEAQRLLTILLGRLQDFLKELVKLSKNSSSKKHFYDQYKEMYALTLRLKQDSTSFAEDLCKTMENLKEKHVE